MRGPQCPHRAVTQNRGLAARAIEFPRLLTGRIGRGVEMGDGLWFAPIGARVVQKDHAIARARGKDMVAGAGLEADLLQGGAVASQQAFGLLRGHVDEVCIVVCAAEGHGLVVGGEGHIDDGVVEALEGGPVLVEGIGLRGRRLE